MKKIYLAAITLITIGCVLYGTLGHHDGRLPISIGESGYSISESATLEEFNRITIDAAVLDLNVEEGTSYTLDYHGTENLVMSYRIENGELIVEQELKKSTGVFEANNATLTLTVPGDAIFEKTDIAIDVGDVRVKGLDTNSYVADIDVGDITIEDSALQNLVIDADTGDVELNDCNFENLDISSDVGDVEVESNTDLSGYSFDLRTDVGEVEVNEMESGKKYYMEGGKGTLTILGNVGDITIEY